ncbi:MAG: hypothetical protein GW778_03220 [Alphaproteobacteria bacterium]|nr:hypothetical protein [Alphaproteobacteria bacterium]
MDIIRNKNWSFKWTNMGVPGKSNYVAMFTAPHIKTNIIYTYQNLNEILVGKTGATVPHNILIEALQSFLSEQVYGGQKTA